MGSIDTRRLLRGFVVGVFAASVAITPAASASTRLPGLTAVFGPVLFGNEVVTAVDQEVNDTEDDVFVGSTPLAGGKSRSLSRVRLNDPLFPLVDLAGGAEVAISAAVQVDDCGDGENSGSEPCGTRSTVTVYRPGAKASLEACASPEIASVHQFVAADRARVAFMTDRGRVCGRKSRLKIVDYSNSHSTVATVATGGDPVQSVALAGNYAAWAQSINDRESRLVVWNVSKHREVLRQRIPSAAAALALDDDGTAALLYTRTAEAKAPTASCVRRRSVQLIPRTGRTWCLKRNVTGIRVELHNGTLAAAAVYSGSTYLSLIQARSSKLIARFQAFSSGDVRFDFDGRRLAWLNPRCATDNVFVASARERPKPSRSTACR